MTDDVIADIAGQSLVIVLHGPESAHKNGIVKTNIHSHIHSRSPIHTPKIIKAKPLTHQTERLRLVVLFLSNVVVGNGQEAWQILLDIFLRP